MADRKDQQAEGPEKTAPAAAPQEPGAPAEAAPEGSTSSGMADEDPLSAHPS